MSWNDLPDEPATPTETAAPMPQPARPAVSGVRKGIATVLLAAGLLTIGGVAVVSAADPSASPSTAASDDGGTAPSDDATVAPDRQGRNGGDHLCPEDGTGSGSGDDGSNGGGTTPTPAPSTAPDSDV